MGYPAAVDSLPWVREADYLTSSRSEPEPSAHRCRQGRAGNNSPSSRARHRPSLWPERHLCRSRPPATSRRGDRAFVGSPARAR